MFENLKLITSQVSENIESFQFNKSVAKIYEFVNIMSEGLSKNKISKDSFKWSLDRLCIILQPFVPHISEEIWSKINQKNLCIEESWPVEEIENKDENFNIAVQINGKTRSIIEINKAIGKEKVFELVEKDKKITKYIENKKIIKKIYVPGKIVNFVL